MKLGKKAKKITAAGVQSAILVIVIIVVLFSVYAAMVPEAQTAGDALNDSNRCGDVGCYWNTSGASGDECQVNSTSISTCTASGESLPLGNIFGSTGVVFVVLMAMLLIVVIVGLLKASKK